MSAWQRFKAFPKAVRVWCWILAAATVYLIANTIYLNSESPHYHTTAYSSTVTRLSASQMNNLCHSPTGRAMQLANSSSVATCHNAQSIEQQKAISAWLLVLVAFALLTLLLVFQSKTRSTPQATASPPGWTP
ncbi:MAG TPA: hypothetical protein VNF47_10730 [Streptosporangiaceae bacterium]|nr:hypothetical protein [Streptosporangiaceae bacterium]